jgi:glucans biosynthesis protein C
METTTRRYELDWLRVFATVSVFIFHCLRVFDLGAFHIKSTQPNPLATILTSFLLQWMMPLFFLISGASIYFALDARTLKQFLRERCLRLLVPFVFGVFILSPPQVYLERLSNPDNPIGSWHGATQFSGSFLEFIPEYFQGWYLFGGNFAWMGLHLWYLLVLFLFSFMCLPLFLTLRTERGKTMIIKVSNFLKQPGAIFLLTLPLAWLEIGLHPMGLGIRVAGGWNFFIYLVLLLYGYFLVADQRIDQAIRKQGWVALAIAILTTPLVVNEVAPLLFSRSAFDTSNYAWLMLIRVINLWCWLIALISFGMRYLSFSNQFLKYANQASLPFYILHQPILLIVAFYILKWNVGFLLQISTLVMGAFIAIVLCYEVLIRRINLLCFLFGVRSMRI